MCEVILTEQNLRVLAYSVLSATPPHRKGLALNEEVDDGCVCELEGTKKKKKEMDDEMDGRVMDDTAGRQSLSVAEIKNRKKKKKKEKKLGGGMQVGRKWRRKGTRVERRRDAAERRQRFEITRAVGK